MDPRRLPRLVFSALLLGALGLAAAPVSVSDASESPSRQDEKASGGMMTRSADPVVIKGKEFPSMKGLGLDGFRLFVFSRGQWQPVPFQIDEMDGDGFYVLPSGKRPNKDTGKGERAGELDDDDELVFMVSDVGEKAPSGRGQGGLGERCAAEIEVRDPSTGAKGWAYLLWFEHPPAPSPTDYVRFDPRQDRVFAQAYTLGYSPAKDLVYTTYMAIPHSGSGADLTDASLLDRVNIRFTASIFLKSITFSRNEDDFVSEVIAYKDGPVRVMRRVANSMRLALGVQSPKIIAYSVYYRDSIETPNTMHLPVGLGSVAKSIYFEGGSDYTHNAFGMQFYCSEDTRGFLADGRMSPQERSLEQAEHEWTVMSGPQGTIMSRVEMGQGLKGVLGKRLIYIDDLERSNAPEDEPGTTPKIGFALTNILALKKGTYYYNVHFYFLPSYVPGREKPYLDIIDHPVEVRVQGLGSS